MFFLYSTVGLPLIKEVEDSSVRQLMKLNRYLQAENRKHSVTSLAVNSDRLTIASPAM